MIRHSSPVSPMTGLVTRRIERWREPLSVWVDDAVAEEIPVAMIYNGHSFAVMMATPQDLEDFALGFSLSEGLITEAGQLLQVETRTLLEGVSLDITVAETAHGAHFERQAARLLPGRSGCGICGTRELENAVRQPRPVGGETGFSRRALEHALSMLQDHQPINAATGAVHAAAWADARGELTLVREDVGRHNALDKLVGALHQAHIDTATGFVLVTSRASYEMVTKAAAAGIPLLAAISAPTALAIELARSSGITLVGFARRGCHNVYSHSWRLQEPEVGPYAECEPVDNAR